MDSCNKPKKTITLYSAPWHNVTLHRMIGNYELLCKRHSLKVGVESRKVEQQGSAAGKCNRDNFIPVCLRQCFQPPSSAMAVFTVGSSVPLPSFLILNLLNLSLKLFLCVQFSYSARLDTVSSVWAQSLRGSLSHKDHTSTT